MSQSVQNFFQVSLKSIQALCTLFNERARWFCRGIGKKGDREGSAGIKRWHLLHVTYLGTWRRIVEGVR